MERLCDWVVNKGKVWVHGDRITDGHVAMDMRLTPGLDPGEVARGPSQSAALICDQRGHLRLGGLGALTASTEPVPERLTASRPEVPETVRTNSFRRYLLPS